MRTISVSSTQRFQRLCLDAFLWRGFVVVTWTEVVGVCDCNSRLDRRKKQHFITVLWKKWSRLLLILSSSLPSLAVPVRQVYFVVCKCLSIDSSSIDRGDLSFMCLPHTLPLLSKISTLCEDFAFWVCKCWATSPKWKFLYFYYLLLLLFVFKKTMQTDRGPKTLSFQHQGVE